MNTLDQDATGTLRYHWVETAWLPMWLAEGDAVAKTAMLNRLLAAGKLEILGGGWVMNDEALPGFDAVIDQMTEGHLWLLNNIGPNAVAVAGWQIDPFGNMASTARLFSQMGFKYQCVGCVSVL